MPKIPINGPLSLSQNIPNVDGRFGPYTSVAEANEYLGPAVSPTDEYDDVISAGMLFGVYEDDGSVTICMWTKDHATVNDFKRISHAQVVQFNGIVTGIVSINQSSGATAKTASDIKYLEQNKKFGYLQGSGYIVNWVNRYIWADASQNPYQDVLYLNIATNALYYYTGTALVALTAGSQGSLVTSVNGQTGAVTITIPTKLSDLTNDVGFITNAGVTSFNGQTGAVTYTPPVTSVNNKTGAVVLSPSDIGLGNVDNTHDANKQVYSAVHDGSGNPIDETYETKTHATAQHSLLQSNIDSLANVAANLTGLEGTNFGGFSLAVDAATAVSNIPTVFTQNGCTVGQPYWFLAGADMSALVAYRYIGSGTPAAISATEYDFTDFSGLSEQVKDFKGTITTLSDIDNLHNVADVGVYHVKVSQFSGFLIVEKYNDGLNTTITQQLIASGTPVNQGGSYTIEKGQTLARRAYSSGAWTSWIDPIAELQANVASLGPKIDQVSDTLALEKSLVINKKYNLTWTKNKCIQGDGSVRTGMSDNSYACEQYIPVKAGDTLYFNIHAPGTTNVCAWYDSSKTFISSFTVLKNTASTHTQTAPQDGYVRVSNELSAVSSPYIQLVTDNWKSNEELNAKIDLSTDPTPLYNILESGFADIELSGINATNGGNTVDGSRVRFINAVPTANVDSIVAPNGYYVLTVCYYSAWTDINTFTFSTGTNYDASTGKKVTIDKTYPYFRVAFKTISGAATTISEFYAAFNMTSLPMEREDSLRSLSLLSADKKFDIDWEVGCCIGKTGAYTPLSSTNVYGAKRYIPVKAGQVLYMHIKAPGASDVCAWYDKNFKFVSWFTINNANVTVPQDGYLRVSNEKSGIADPYIQLVDSSWKSNIELEEMISDTPTPTPTPTPSTTTPAKPYYVPDLSSFSTLTDLSDQLEFTPTTLPIEHKYNGKVTPTKRYMCVGFDDFRDSDFTSMMPLFEKYGFKATFNRIAAAIAISDADNKKMSNLVYGGHELGDHTWTHNQFPYTEPMFNGQDPSNPDGNQVPFPSNSQMRDDRGDGKNAFGMDLTTAAKTSIGYNAPDINTAWGSLSDAECQTIRNYFSVMKDSSSGLITILDTLSNTYFGTTGSSAGSWDDTEGCYTGGIFTGCKTSANHEIWERILALTIIYYREAFGLNCHIRTWSLPGSKQSKCWFENNGKKYYDTSFTKPVNYLAKFQSSTIKDQSGAYVSRSWIDVLRKYGFAITHDTIWPGRLDGNNTPSYCSCYQFVLNAYGRRKDALLNSSNQSKHFDYNSIASAYPESDMIGTKSLPAQMYDSASHNDFKNFIEGARLAMSNGRIAMETSDSANTYSFRLFFEGLLKYCKETGVELVTKQEAYDICFNHPLTEGNLIYNPLLRNTAKEFMPDAESIPDNPDGYSGTCSVTYDTDNTPILVTAGDVNYAHFGIPNGNIQYKAKAKGSGTITIKLLKNNSSRYYNSLTTLATINVSGESFADVTASFKIVEAAATTADAEYDGLGNKTIGVLILYSTGLQVKDIDMRKV